MKRFARTLAVAVTAAATLGLGVTSATAAVPPASSIPGYGLPCNKFFYISGDAVRIRKSPGGTIRGLMWYGTRVIPGRKVGSWQYVTFPSWERGLTPGWVSTRFIRYSDKKTDLCPY